MCYVPYWTGWQNDTLCDSVHIHSHLLGTADDPLYAMLLHNLNKFLALLVLLVFLTGLFAEWPLTLVLDKSDPNSVSVPLLGFYIWQWYYPMREFSFSKSLIVLMLLSSSMIWSQRLFCAYYFEQNLQIIINSRSAIRKSSNDLPGNCCCHLKFQHSTISFMRLSTYSCMA